MLNIYYELPTNHPVVLRYWVQPVVSYTSHSRINYNSKLMWAAVRAWIEENSEVRCVKNRYVELTNNLGVDIEVFNKVKSLARDLYMMSMRKFSEGVIYVAFPPRNYQDDRYLIPAGLEEWVEQNAKPDWGIIKGQRAGVFLSEQDATAFKLRWM